MRLAIALAGLSLLGACDRIFGLTGRDDTDGGAGDMLDPGMPIDVTGTWKRIDVLNNVDGAPDEVVGRLTDDDELVVTSFGRSIPVQLNRDDGTFAFSAPTPYEVRAGAIEWQSSSPTLVLEDVRFGRPDALLSTQATIVGTISPPPTGGGESVLISTGVYSLQSVTFNSENKFSADWAKGAIFGGPPRLVDTTRQDTLQVVTYRATGTAGQTLLSRSASTTLQMIDGENTVELESAIAPAVGCATVVPTVNLDIERLAVALPQYTSALGGWEIVSTPLPELFGVRIPLLLANYYLENGAVDESEVTFPNPFSGHAPTIVQNSIASRTLPTGAAVSASITHQRVFPAEITVPCMTLEVQGVEIALPHTPKLANISLDTDGLVIAVPDRDFIDLTWEITDGIEPEVYGVSLGVVPASGAAVEYIHSITTPARRARLAASLFEPDTRYVLRVIGAKGNLQRADGDFSSSRLPVSFASSTSSSFSVAR